MSKKEKWRTCPRKQQNRLHRGFSRHSSRASFTAASVVVRHYFELHKPFCSAECKFNLTGQPNYPVGCQNAVGALTRENTSISTHMASPTGTGRLPLAAARAGSRFSLS